MRKLARPTIPAVEVLQECAATITDADFRNRLDMIADEVGAAETRYVQRAELAELFEIISTDGVLGLVSLEEMVWLYDAKLSRLKDSARPIYDGIKLAPVNGICPLCGQRVVSTLDHYLAKTKYPVYTITPSNLVPACSDCNKLKRNRHPADAADQTLHPYFDDVEGQVWLRARLLESDNPAVIFFTDPPDQWDPILRDRIRLHFQTFGLAELYAANAAGELAGLRLELVTIHDSTGDLAVRDHLRLRADARRAVEKNSWQFAMYDALARSEWFCAEGYKYIPSPTSSP